MRIVHFSDWHGSKIELPSADLYVCTGDMLRNFPVVEQSHAWRHYRIDPALEAVKQREWASIPENQLKRFLGNGDAPIVCVRGNHDFIPIASLFTDCDVTELVCNELYEIAGMRITGHRGIPWIYGGWNDEVQRPDLFDRCRSMPNADLYVTHYPPHDMLDAGYGLDGMLNLLTWRHIDDRALHCFGHIHECGGLTQQLERMTFSNAATGFNIIDL